MANNNEIGAKDIESKVLDLSKSMERIKARNADRDDVVVELNQSQLSRLELLARDLQPVFEQVPDDNDQFEFGLTKGETPRLWIDVSTHVRMGAQPHQYELVKDTRMGRTILAASTDKEVMGQLVTDYVAGKIIERERLLEGEWIALSGYNFDEETSQQQEPETQIVRKAGFWRSMFWFLFGAIVSVGSLFAWAWYGNLPDFLQ